MAPDKKIYRRCIITRSGGKRWRARSSQHSEHLTFHKGLSELTGLFTMCFLLCFCFLMCVFKALESSGFRSSKLQSSSALTDMTAPQLSNSPQY